MTYLFKRTDLALVAVSAFLLTGCGAKKAEDDPAPSSMSTLPRWSAAMWRIGWMCLVPSPQHRRVAAGRGHGASDGAGRHDHPRHSRA
jgi:hypothetical protein